MLIKVKVRADENVNEIIKKDKDSFEVKVKEPPIQGQANRAVARILAKYFGLEINEIKLIRGWRQSNKIFEIKK